MIQVQWLYRLRSEGHLNPGTAGALARLSSTFTQDKAEPINLARLAFHGGGRDARGPSELIDRFHQE